MNLLTFLRGKRKSHSATTMLNVRKTDTDYQQEALIAQGREQFQKLVERGLGIPVALV